MSMKASTHHTRHFCAKGGRLVKFKGRTASLAPTVLGAVAPLMVAGALSVIPATGALAFEECGSATPPSTTVTCDGDYGTNDVSDGIDYLYEVGRTPANAVETLIINDETLSIDILPDDPIFSGDRVPGLIGFGVPPNASGDRRLVLQDFALLRLPDTATNTNVVGLTNGLNFIDDLTLEMNGGLIEAVGDGTKGMLILSSQSAGQLNLVINGGTIITRGDAGPVVTNTSDRALGAYVFNLGNPSAITTGLVEMNGGAVLTFGDNADAVMAVTSGLGAQEVVMTGGRIETQGASANGLAINIFQQNHQADSTINFSGGSVLTTGDGINLGGSPGHNPQAAGADGVTAYTRGTGRIIINVSDTASVETQGSESDAISAYGLNTNATEVVINATGGTVLATGQNANAITGNVIDGSTEINVDMLVRGGWGNSDGVFATSGAAGSNAIDIGTGGYVTAASDSAVRAASGATNVTNDGTILGTVNLSDGDDTFANNSANSWNIRQFADTDGDGIRDEEAVAVNNYGAGTDTVTNGANGVVRLLTVEDRSGFTSTADDDVAPLTWNQTGEYTFTGRDSVTIRDFGVEQAQLLNLETFNNAGIITMADSITGGTGPVAGDIIVITAGSTAGTANGGEFISNGGELHLDTVLNDGQTDMTDLLVVDNARLGTVATTIRITNAMVGQGASTDINGNGTFDSDEGILVVQVLEGGDADAFTLGGIVRDGAWEYVLEQTDGQNWYLQSELASQTPTFEVVQQTLLDLAMLPTLMDRVGNRVWAVESTAFAGTEFVFCKDPEQNFSCPVTPEQAEVFAGEPVSDTYIEGQGVWVQVDGTRIQYEADSGTTGASYDATIAGLQVGYDHVLMETADGDRLIGGVKLRYQTSDADVSESNAESNISSTGIGLGGSLTWYDVDGLYVDAQAQVMTIETDMSASGIGQFVDGERLTGYSFALEVGKEIPFDDTITVTPQVQLSYATATEDGFTDEQGVDVSFEAESIKLRAGVEVTQATSWEAEDGTTSRRDLTVGAHVTKEFSPETTVDVSGTTLRSEADDTTGELTLGGTYNWSDDRYSVYGKVGAATGLNSFGDTTKVSGTVGMRLQWE